MTLGEVRALLAGQKDGRGLVVRMADENKSFEVMGVYVPHAMEEPVMLLFEGEDPS